MWLLFFLFSTGSGNALEYTFPEDFMLGIGSAAYQIEGAWNESGKGPSIWDTMTHNNPQSVSDGSNADIACDSYHRYKDDVQLVKNLEMKFYRFSISWPRILPTGHVHEVNKAGIEYYNNLINELKSSGIEPIVTMYHWDLPYHLQEFGGWANPIMADYFEDYAHVLFTNFGDRVKWWITIQDPKYVAAAYGMDKGMAPAVNSSGIGEYMATHTLLMAHANVYRLYDTKFRKIQQGKVGVSIHAKWYEPLDDKEVNVAAQDRVFQFVVGIFAHPIFSVQGDYPAIVKERIARKSKEEGFVRSRLPALSPEEILHVRGTSDFLGLNHYTTKLVQHNELRGADVDVEMSDDPTWSSTATSWFKVVPWGFRKLLVWLKEEYGNIPIFVTENGFSDIKGHNDKDRVMYFINYMSEMLKAMKQDNCSVIGYIAWSLMDSFEWNEGYTERYGLYAVNFSDPMRRRMAKDSVYVLSHIVKTRQIPRYLVQVEDTEPDQRSNYDPLDRTLQSTSAADGRDTYIYPLHLCFLMCLIYLYGLFQLGTICLVNVQQQVLSKLSVIPAYVCKFNGNPRVKQM